MKILFEITNCDSDIAMFEPVIKVLQRKYLQCELYLLSLCEVIGLHTDQHKVASIAQDFLQTYKLPFKVQTRNDGLRGKVSNEMSYLRMLRMKHKVGEHMGKLLESLHPDVIIFSNDRITPHLSLIKAAKNRRIPTLLVQESIRKDDHYKLAKVDRLRLQLIRFLFSVVEGPLLCHGQGGCDRIAAWGETSREYFKMVGVPEEKVVLTGNPRIESITKRNWQREGHELRKRYSIPEDVSIIAFTTNPVDGMGILTGDQLLESVSMVVNAVASLKNVYLFLKPHRFENIERYRRAVAESPAQDRILVEKNIDLYPLLSISDACLIFNSTVALEASVLSVPVAVVNPFQVDMGIDFVENGLTVEITNEKQLISFLQSCRSGEYSVATDVIQKYLAIIDGSADMIADEILKLATWKR
uniref:UDP-N-acetylglucosamine 2-epimerase domain-containing protein n=1 Tax=Candidatus Methanophaga sp. ANME-1 ERB7 TaxID=2759913 RepID=A0A7G9Z2J0_9EURY|nr:hypothetical protein ILIMKHIM_00003 [Methanosarcinales archaeon ANME-1 ERB7]